MVIFQIIKNQMLSKTFDMFGSYEIWVLSYYPLLLSALSTLQKYNKFDNQNSLSDMIV